MKKTVKLRLSRETLRLLDGGLLKQADGGVTTSGRFCSDGTSCPSYCQVTNCL